MVRCQRQGQFLIVQFDARTRSLEVEPCLYLSLRLIHGVAHLLRIHLGHDIKRVIACHTPCLPALIFPVFASLPPLVSYAASVIVIVRPVRDKTICSMPGSGTLQPPIITMGRVALPPGPSLISSC